MAFTEYIPDYNKRPEWNQAGALSPPAPAPQTGGAPAPPTGIVSGAMAPPPTQPAGFGMVGSASAPTVPTAPGGLQAIYDTNKTNPAAVAAYMKANNYTAQRAADELKIPVGYVSGWFSSAGIGADQYESASSAGFGMVGGAVAPPPAPTPAPPPFGMVSEPAPGTPTPFATYVNQNLTNPQAVATAIKDKQFTSWEQAAGEMGYPADAEGVKFIHAYLERSGFGPDQYNTWLKSGSPGMVAPPTAGPPPAGSPPGSPIAGVGTPPAASGIVSSQFNRTALGPQTNWDVTAPQTVEARINALVNPNNPLIAQARANALPTANERGLMNSSMAMTAADAAAYQVAASIAQADAATFAKAAGYNADQANQRSLADATMGTQFTTAQMNNAASMDQARLAADTSRANAQLGADTSLAQTRLTTENQAAIQRMNNESTQLLNRLDAESRATLQATLNASNQLIQTNAQASSAFNTSASAIDNIQRSTTMDATAKTRAIAYVNYQLQQQLTVLGATASLNLTANLNFAGQPGFDAQGRWVGFDGDTATTASTSPVAPPAAPAPNIPAPGAPGSPNYYDPTPAGP